LIALSPSAQDDIQQLARFYAERERPAAIRNLAAAVARAAVRIERDPAAGLAAPRPYPKLAKPGRAWVKEGPYWIAYATTNPPVISGVFHEAADIPRRIR